MSIIAGALLQGLGQGMATVGGFGMKYQQMLDEMELKRQQRLEELRVHGEQQRESIALTGEETRKTRLAEIDALQQSDERQRESTLKVTNPALLQKGKSIVAGAMTDVADESGGHAGPVTLTPEEQRQWDEAGLKPNEKATLRVQERTAQRQDEQFRETVRMHNEQLKLSHATAARQMTLAEAQLKRAESAEWASLYTADLKGYAERLSPLNAQLKLLERKGESLRKMVPPPTDLADQLSKVDADIQTITEEARTISTDIAGLQAQSRAKRTGTGAPSGDRKPLSSFMK